MKKKRVETGAADPLGQGRGNAPARMAVHVRDGVLYNDFCRDCRFCCGPQPAADKPFPMKLLDSQLESMERSRFYWLNTHTACLDSRGCPSLGEGGCLLERADRPVACNIFPFVVINGRLFLYLHCPLSAALAPAQKKSLARALARRLRLMPAVDLSRISLRRNPRKLKRAYEDLHLPLAEGRAPRRGGHPD